MLPIKKYIAGAFVIVLLAAAPVFAGDTPSEIKQRVGTGDPLAGKEKSALCQGCHGEDGNSDSPIFPKLAGQWADYTQKQVRDFQSLSRINETMNEIALNVVNYDDLFDIAAYFASQKMMVGTPTQNEAGRKLYYEGDAAKGVFRCVKCHGENGKGEPLNNNLFPVIGGQHKEYLVKQLKEFKSNFRENDHSGMMPRITSNMTEAEMEAVAEYLSGQ